MKHLSISLNQGLVAALVNFAVIVGCYLVNIGWMVEWWFGLSTLAIIVVFMFLAGAAARKENGNVLSFGEAFVAVFLTAAFAQVASALLTWVLYTWIAPELPATLSELTIAKTQEMLNNFGMDTATIDAQMDEIKAAMAEAYTLAGLAKNSAYGLAMWAFVSLVVAAIAKRKPTSEFA